MVKATIGEYLIDSADLGALVRRVAKMNNPQANAGGHVPGHQKHDELQQEALCGNRHDSTGCGDWAEEERADFPNCHHFHVSLAIVHWFIILLVQWIVNL